MNKYLLRRIGVASNAAATRPSLSECIELVLDQSDALVGDVLDALLAPLHKPLKAGLPDDVDPAIRYAVRQLVDERDLVCSTFGDALRRLVYFSGSQDFGEAPMSRIEDIHVFDIDALEAHIEQALARREVNRSVDDILPKFHSFISSLLGWTSVQPALNPLKPEAFVRALQETLDTCVADDHVRSVLLRPAAIALGIAMGQVYREACAWMRSQGVAPVGPADGKPARGAGRSATGAQTELERTLAILDKLHALLGHASLPGSEGGAQQDYIHTVPGALVALQDMKMEESMFQRLKRQALPPAVSRLNEAAGLADDAPVLARARQRQIGRQLGEEVVRLMFDQMGQDERIAAPVRLQMRALEPVLVRLADLDPRFFLDRAHPARTFVDRVAQAGGQLLHDDQDGIHGFAACLANAVAAIGRSPLEAAIFASAWDLLEHSWGDFEATRRQQREHALREREHIEKRVELAQRFAEALVERFRNAALPALLADFLRGPWSQVLAETSLRSDDDTPDPRGYLALVDDLVWSVQRAADGRGYERLVGLIPRLLARINEGLVLIRYPQESLSIFLDELSDLHDKVLADHRSAIAAGRAALAARAAQLPREPDAEPEPEPVVEASDSVSAPAPQDHAEPSELAIGAWADLLLGGVWVRARLTWIGRNRNLFMFVSGSGLAHAMTRRTMDRLQTQGRLRLGFAPPQLDLQLDSVHGLLTAMDDDDLHRQPVYAGGGLPARPHGSR